MSNHYQTIVIGAGAIGSATAYWLAQHGQTDVLVLEQFELGHGNGASNDHSRIIRHSYHNNTYGRLTQAAYDNWSRLEAESGQKVVFKTGGLDIAATDSPGAASVENYRRTLADNGHPYKMLGTKQLVEKYPQWNIDEDVTAVFSPDSGLVDIRRACQVHIAMAMSLGVSVLDNTAVRKVESAGESVRVFTDTDTYTADRVVLATASWSDSLLQDLGQTWTTTISQEQVGYFVPKDISKFSMDKFSVWAWHGSKLFYGFPIYGEVAVKLARDMSGRFVTHSTRSMIPVEDETELLANFLRDKLPAAYGRELYSKTCIYDMPPDRDFIIDSVPGNPRILLGVGAGHAAKFGGLFGAILAELAVTGRSSHPIDAFKADRPALTDPSYIPAFMLTKN